MGGQKGALLRGPSWVRGFWGKADKPNGNLVQKGSGGGWGGEKKVGEEVGPCKIGSSKYPFYAATQGGDCGSKFGTVRPESKGKKRLGGETKRGSIALPGVWGT